MTDLIRLCRSEGLLLPLQITLLIVDAYLFLSVSDGNNIWVALSLMLVLSLFILQGVRGRFLLLSPRNGFVDHESVDIDTWYLRLVVGAASILAIMGLTATAVPDYAYTAHMWQIVTGAAVLFLLVVPVVFAWRSESINDRIADKLSRHPYTAVIDCPFCRNLRSAIDTRMIINRHTGIKQIQCLQCHADEPSLVRLNVGEVIKRPPRTRSS